MAFMPGVLVSVVCFCCFLSFSSSSRNTSTSCGHVDLSHAIAETQRLIGRKSRSFHTRPLYNEPPPLPHPLGVTTSEFSRDL